jgi:WD40 repeat protein
LALAPKGRSFAFASKDGHTRIWDELSGEFRQLADGHRHYVHAVAYSPDGLTLATGSGDQTIVVRRLDSGAKTRILHDHDDRVSAVAFSPDGTTIVSGSWDRSVRMWKAATGDSVWSNNLTHNDRVMATVFSPDGSIVASASTDRTIRLWDARTGKPVQREFCRHGGYVYGVVWSPDGSRLASCSGDKTIAVWNSHQPGPPITTMRQEVDVTSVVWVPNSGDIISASALGEDHLVRRWNAFTGQLLATYAGNTSPVLSIAAFPDGQTIALGCEDGSVRLWDAHFRTVLLECRIGSEPRRISFVRKSPNGTMFAACTADGYMEVMDATSGKRLGAFRTSTSPIDLSFNEDGTILIASYLKGRYDDWSAGRNFEVPPSPATTPRVDITFSADAEGWIFASDNGRTTPRRLFLAPKDLRWSDWSSQAASVGAVLAFGSDSGVLTVIDFTPVLTEVA